MQQTEERGASLIPITDIVETSYPTVERVEKLHAVIDWQRTGSAAVPSGAAPR